MNAPDEAISRRAWIDQCTAGIRGSDHLTIDERTVLLRLKSAGYELVRSAYRERYTGQAA